MNWETSFWGIVCRGFNTYIILAFLVFGCFIVPLIVFTLITVDENPGGAAAPEQSVIAATSTPMRTTLGPVTYAPVQATREEKFEWHSHMWPRMRTIMVSYLSLAEFLDEVKVEPTLLRDTERLSGLSDQVNACDVAVSDAKTYVPPASMQNVHQITIDMMLTCQEAYRLLYEAMSGAALERFVLAGPRIDAFEACGEAIIETDEYLHVVFDE